MPTPSLPALQNRSATPRGEVGGLAVVDGVMIRSRTGHAVAVRRPDGAIVVRQVPRRARTAWFERIPVVRGAAGLAGFMLAGARALQWSGEVRGGAAAEPAAARVDRDLLLMCAASTLALAALVLAVPAALAALAGSTGPLDAWAQARGTLGFSEENHPFAFNLVAGAMRAGVLLAYVAALGLSAEVRRVFACHGAEHMAVADLEAGGALSVESARTRSPRHPRCGTTFLVFALALAIPVFAAADAVMASSLPGFPDLPWWQRRAASLLVHAALLPVVAGVAWELLKIVAARPASTVAAVLLAPGMMLQRLTTRRPDDGQIEVALVALLAALDIAPGEARDRTWVVRGLHSEPEESVRVRVQKPAGDEPRAAGCP